jgi:hypothetical protein
MTRAEWVALGKKRLVSVLRARIVATDRTLEQKISDAGPNNQRVEPVLLTQARNELVKAGRIVPVKPGKTPWFHLAETTQERIQERLAVLEPIYMKTQEALFTQRMGQVLEIAVLKALKGGGRAFLGSFADLEEHDDSSLYKKVDPPLVISGNKIEKGPLDYVIFAPAGTGGIEIKNYRTWLYPDSPEVRDLLWKCSDVGAVPVLITRRVPFITFRLFNLSGCLVHQGYNQLYPAVDAELAAAVRDKSLLGYHDVRLGSEPDKRMTRFIQELLPRLVGTGRSLFEKFRAVHAAFGRRKITYTDWVRLVLVGSGVWADRAEDGGDSGWEEWM